MRRKLIMCPETAHLEEVEYVTTPLGMIIASCSRFPGKLACTRECAARSDASVRTGNVTADPTEWLEKHGAAVVTDTTDETDKIDE